jgi:hypothetical protein
LEKPDQRTPDQSAELDHQADDSPNSPPPANRIRFPTGTTICIDNKSTIACVVRDLSNTGASLEIESPIGIPGKSIFSVMT